MAGRPTDASAARLRWLTVGVLVGTAVLAAVLVARGRGHIPDDAYITFRYARNLDAGRGWTFDPGRTTTDAATSTLYTVLLAGVYRLRADMVAEANAIYVATIAAAATILYATLRSLGDQVSGLATAVLVVVSPWIVATAGMETAPFLALTAGCLGAFVSRRGYLTGVLLTLLVACRPEGALLAAVLVVAWIVRDRRLPTQLLIGGIASGVVWLLSAYLLTGHLWADTLSAKAAQGQSGYWGDRWSFLRGVVTHPFFRSWFLVLCGLAALGLLVAIRNRRLWPVVGPLVAFALLHLLFLGVVYPVPAYSWYYGIEALTLSVLAGIGVGGLTHSFRRGSSLRIAAGVVGVGLLAITVVLGFAQQAQGDSVAHYKELAAWIRAHTPRGSSLAATEIGTLGWETGRPMVDYLGLLSAASVRDIRRGDFASWLERDRPDYWVVHDPPWSFEAPASTSTYFRDHYALAAALSVPWNGPESLRFHVYRRRRASIG